MPITCKLKEYRILRSLTQEELAKSSGISIRTIQRMEKGFSSGSPHTNKALANTLDIESEALLSLEENATTQTQNGISIERLMNLSILTVLVLPLGNILIPSILYYLNRDQQSVQTIGRRILSFQILSTVLLFFLTIVLFLILGRGNGAIPQPVTSCYLLYVMTSFTTVLLTANDINKGREVLTFAPAIL